MPKQLILLGLASQSKKDNDSKILEALLTLNALAMENVETTRGFSALNDIEISLFRALKDIGEK